MFVFNVKNFNFVFTNFLQYVPITIQTLLAAGIRIWILTGDKRETAINIAQSSGLCSKDTKLLTLEKRSYDEVFYDLNTFKKIVSFIFFFNKNNFKFFGATILRTKN